MVKESFKLRRVSIKHHYLVGPRLLDHVCHEFGGDGGAEAGLLVPLGVGEVGGDDCDGLGRGQPARVYDEQQLHHSIVRVHST